MGRGLTAGVRRDVTYRRYFAAGVKPAFSRTACPSAERTRSIHFCPRSFLVEALTRAIGYLGVGLVDDSGVGLAGGDLAAHVGDGLFLGDGVQGDAELLGEGLGELAAGDLGGAHDELDTVEGGVQAGHARRVAGRGDEGEGVGDEDGLRINLRGVGGLLHGGLVGGGQDVNIRALAELGHQVLGAREVETHVHAGVGGLEGLLKLTEGLGQRGGGVDVEDGLLGGGLGRGRRGRGVSSGGRAASAGGEGQGGGAEDGKDAKGTHSSLLLWGDGTRLI